MELGFDPVELLRLPLIKKVAIGLVILAIIGGGYWWLSLGDALKRIESLNAKLKLQAEDITMKERMKARLPELRKELEDLKVKEAKVARKLPSKKEIPALLTDISNAGYDQKLQFFLFAPKSELPVNHYAEVPVSMRFSGPFQATMLFLNQVARLSRIVTFSSLAITPQAQKKNDEIEIVTTAEAKTYRFLDVDSSVKKDKKDGDDKKGGADKKGGVGIKGGNKE